jgi:CubicO group peptidase (beta-lactamase class C family)
VISAASGKNISDYAAEKLWQPIGAVEPAFWSLDHKDGIEKSYCCFYSNARDFARIGKLYLDGGKWNGKNLLSAEYIKQSINPINLPDATGQPVNYYGFHWWLMELEGHSIYYARGILGQYIIVIPDEKIIIVRLGKKRGEKNENHYTDMTTYSKEVLKIFGTNK